MNNPHTAVFFFLSIAAIALYSYLAVAAFAGARSAERKAFYKSDMLKKLAESSEAGATSALEYLREQEKQELRKRRAGLQLGGLITAAVGIGLMIFLRAMVQDAPVFLVGSIPLLIGAALAGYGYTMHIPE